MLHCIENVHSFIATGKRLTLYRNNADLGKFSSKKLMFENLFVFKIVFLLSLFFFRKQRNETKEEFRDVPSVIGQICLKFVSLFGNADCMTQRTWEQRSVIGQIYSNLFPFLVKHAPRASTDFSRSKRASKTKKFQGFYDLSQTV